MKRPLIPVVRLSGVISSGGPTPLARGNLSLEGVALALEKAFSSKAAHAVALIINSPGGSAVQSHLIYQRIRALAEENNKHVIAFVEDAAASGGYMIACAADDIYADQASIIGSIGVISAGFGFPGALDKLGIERRVVAAGSRKGMLDPFSPVNLDDIERLKSLQSAVHEGFVSLVKERRGAKLRDEGQDLFTGEFWAGEKARDLGLIDGIGNIRAVLRERFGDKVTIQPISTARGFFSRRHPATMNGALSGMQGQYLVQDALACFEERSFWSRLGL